MKLRLAEYKDGKFERFLELGKDFLYGGDFIIFTRSSGYFFIDTASQECREQFKDQKDCLNRFGGLFDGRTYGQGRFVLIKDGQFDIYETTHFASFKGEKYYSFRKKTDGISCQLIGNLIENPELWEKVK